jgi:hypothetical protein
MRDAIRRIAHCLREPNSAAAGSTVAPIADATAMNHLEDLLRNIDPFSDSCQKGRKPKATKHAADHSNE